MGRPSKKPQLLEDRISKLPDDILHQILYHLSTKCTVKTSILSKRWHYLWTSTRALHFYCREFSSTSIAKFICFVDRVLFLRDNSDIEKFTLWWQSDFDIYKAKEWLSYALRFNVKEVDLFIKGSFSLPSDLLRCQSLQVLKLTSTFNEFPILKFLSTISTNLSKLKTLYVLTARPCEAITKLISKCPVLENLTMSMASCDFEISTPYLKELTFFCHHGARKVSIFAPNLVRLDVRCFFDRIPELLFECKLENLATASISCIKGCEGGLPGSGRKFLEILRCLQNAKSLTLRGNVVELLHQVSKEPLPSLCNLRSLTINLTMEKRLKVVAIQVMIMLPQKCPNLEKLVVELPKKILRQESISWECHACSLNKLKEVKIVGFHYGDEEEAGLVNFLLHHQRSSLPRVKIYYEISKKMTKKVKSLAFSLGGQP